MRIGVDLGGTKIEAIALADDGQELARQRVATPRGNYDETVQAIAALVEWLEDKTAQVGSVGVGTPGAVSAETGLIKNSNSGWLIGRALSQDLAQAIGRPVRLANDADCLALSEAVDGAAAGSNNVFGVVLGTGTGGGIVINGQLVSGPNSIAGEWGHNPLPWAQWDEIPGSPCYCGKRGCIESFLSGPALSREHYYLTRQRLSADEIAEHASRGEHLMEDTMARYESRLARSLATVINILDPEVVVLGGGVSNIDSLYERVPRLWQEYVFSDVVKTRLVKAKYGDSSGVRGAAWLWPVKNQD
jgi:predicted NBD/HSP70 family sugar kinase